MLLTLFILQTLISITPDDSTKQVYENEVKAWHERRIANLKRDYGWLTLVALDWLHEGTRQVTGIGTLTLRGSEISFRASDGVAVTRSAKPFVGGSLRNDAEHGGPDTVVAGSKAFTIIERGGRFAVRMWDRENPKRKEFKGIERYPVSLQWRFEAKWEPYDPPKNISVATVIPGYQEEYPVPGVAIFTIDGKQYRLEPVLETPDGDYFFIFGDKTNGRETYGGGRYMYSKPAKDGRVIIDFNKSYNPPCVFTDFATCPLPPPENRLPLAVVAGEKYWKPDLH
jgi:hypothetical protein